MAENKNSTVLTVQVGGANVDIDSIAKAKKAVKDLRSEVLKTGDPAALKALGDVTDKLDEVREAAGTATGSGVEKLTSSFSLLGQGITSFDTGKITAGFKGIGAAMGAIPIFLLIQGIQLLIENFDEVIDFAKSFIGSQDQAKAAVDRLTLAIEGESEALKNLMKISDDYTKTELLNAKLRGSSEKELAEVSRQGIERKIRYTQQSIDELNREYIAITKNTEATKEQIRAAYNALKSATDQEKTLKNDLKNFDIQTKIDEKKRTEDHNKELNALAKARIEALKNLNAQSEKDIADSLKRIEDARVKALIAERLELEKRSSDRISQQAKEDAELLKMEEDTSNEFLALANKRADETKKLNEDIAKSKLQAEADGFQAAKDLSEAFFTFQSNRAGQDAAKQNELAKKAFAVNKGLNLAQATIEGLRAVQGTFASTAIYGPVIQIAATAATAAAAAGTLAKIAATKFKGQDAGGSEGQSIGSAPTIASTPNAPTLSTPQTINTTTINQSGNGEPIQAYVSETQLRRVQNRRNFLVENAQWG